MRCLIIIWFSIFSASFLYGQKTLVLDKGVVSYTSTLNVYIKFASTEHIHKGDTLFLQKEDQYLPALLVKDKSSTSCVCSSLLPDKVKVGDTFTAKYWLDKKSESLATPPRKPSEPAIATDSTTAPIIPLVKAPSPDDKGYYQSTTRAQKMKGRLSAASYSSFYGEDATHRMRYTLTLQGTHIKKSRFSTDNYISFRHTIGAWDEIQNNLANALKVYSLSVKYDIDKSSSISLGRKINYRISSMGAIDGLQYEKGIGKKFRIGLLGGWRPDYADYGFNSRLLQAGSYINHTSGAPDKNQESTFAFVEQHNGSQVDRRFVYFQHNNNLWKNLNLFSSFEADLYHIVNEQVNYKPTLTNMLLSMRYRVNRKVGLSLAYDNRKNIIYYESYKNYIDRLIDDETRQGLRLGATWNASKLINCGFNVSKRFQKSQINASENANMYLNFNRLPWIRGMASLNVNLLKTGFLDSKMYGLRLTKELIRNKLQSEIHYRWVDYQYKNYDQQIQQQIAGLDLSWYITRKFALYLYYEGTFQGQYKPFNRINTRIIQRF